MIWFRSDHHCIPDNHPHHVVSASTASTASAPDVRHVAWHLCFNFYRIAERCLTSHQWEHAVAHPLQRESQLGRAVCSQCPSTALLIRGLQPRTNSCVCWESALLVRPLNLLISAPKSKSRSSLCGGLYPARPRGLYFKKFWCGCPSFTFNARMYRANRINTGLWLRLSSAYPHRYRQILASNMST